MARVIYDGKLLEPIQFSPITKQYHTTGDGERIGSTFRITLQGTLVAFKGSPTSSGTFHTSSGRPADEVIVEDSKFASIIQKQEAVRELFSVEGKQLELAPIDGSNPLKFNPRIVGPIQFQQGTWHDTCLYTVELEADAIYVDGGVLGEDSFSPLINEASESWSFETDEPEDDITSKTYRVTHSVSAKGKRFFDDSNNLITEAWVQAQSWVQDRLGFDATIALSSGVNNLPSYYQALDHVRSEQINERGGGYSVTETWILSSGTAKETFDIQETVSQQEGYTAVSVQGTITGFEERDSDMNLTVSKFTNADLKWSGVKPIISQRATTFTGQTLNPQVLSTTIGRNPVTGTITYSYEYDNRPTNLVSDVKSEVIVIGGDFGRDIVASVGVLGRALGPVLQSLSTNQETTRNINLELFFKNDYLPSGTITERLKDNNPRLRSPQSGEIQDIVNAAHPVLGGALNNIGGLATTSFVTEQNESWDISTLHYSLNIAWIYE